MNKITDFLWHMFFPNRCLFCNEIAFYDTIICEKCEKIAPHTDNQFDIDLELYCFDQLICPFLYQDGVDNAIKNFKFYGMKHNAKKLAVFMENSIFQANATAEIDIAIPVPMHEKDINRRDFNQSELLGKALCKLINKPFKTDILLKHKYTKKQHNSTAEERALNLNDAFSIKCNQLIFDKVVLLVDDVFTTGTTMNMCSRVLKQAGAKKIIAIAAAKTNFRKG